MDKFEENVDNLNVQTSYMESAMSNSSALTTPSDQVHDLMQQIADEHGLELGSQLGHAPTSAAIINTGAEKEPENDPLTERLAKLRNS